MHDDPNNDLYNENIKHFIKMEEHKRVNIFLLVFVTVILLLNIWLKTGGQQ